MGLESKNGKHVYQSFIPEIFVLIASCDQNYRLLSFWTISTEPKIESEALKVCAM